MPPVRLPRQLGLPVDRLFGVYAAVAGLALLFRYRPAAWPLLALAHLVAVALGFGLPPAREAWELLARRHPAASRIIGDWYPLILLPALYLELAILNRAIFGGRYFDSIVMGWEQALFRGQPSRSMAAAAPFRWLSEPLHAAYLSYYLIVLVPPIILGVQRRWDAFREAVFTLLLAFFAHYVFFVFFPVQGPRYLFAPPGGEAAEGPVSRLAHSVLQVGSSQGSAFPSSHVGVSVVQCANAFRFLPRFAHVLVILTAGLSVGAVYGGFHYAIDALAGLALGTACAMAGPMLYRRLLPARRCPADPPLVVAA